jgi:hypothetical protein
MWMATHPALVLHSQGEQIRAVYGGDDEGLQGRRGSGQAGIGPFSLRSYLSHMLESGSWGDQVFLSAISMMWNCRVSLVNAEGLYTLNYRHGLALGRSDVVIVYNGETHFMGTGNSWFAYSRSIR